MGVGFGWKKCAGLVSVWRGRWAVHLFVQRSHWEWGRQDSWYDGPLYSWGLGPLLLVCWQPED